jgi:hypothetical protein
VVVAVALEEIPGRVTVVPAVVLGALLLALSTWCPVKRFQLLP